MNKTKLEIHTRSTIRFGSLPKGDMFEQINLLNDILRGQAFGEVVIRDGAVIKNGRRMGTCRAACENKDIRFDLNLKVFRFPNPDHDDAISACEITDTMMFLEWLHNNPPSPETKSLLNEVVSLFRDYQFPVRRVY